LTGHIQIQEAHYPDDPSVAHRIASPDIVTEMLSDTLPQGSHWSLRVRVDAVANNARHSTGVTMVGINPPAEANLSFIGHAVVQGHYLEPGDTQGILIGRALAEQFDTVVGHKLILMSQSAGGAVVSRAFRIEGIFQAEMQATEKSYVFVDLPAAQRMLGIGEDVSEIDVLLPDYHEAPRYARMLAGQLTKYGITARSWQQVQPLLVVHLDLYSTFTFIWYFVVFVAMGFGIVNTTLMAVYERIREFGLLKALGMRPLRIVRNILFESAWILLIGMGCGTLLGILSSWLLSFTGIDLSAFAKGTEYFGITRIIYPKLITGDLISANAVVLVLGLIISLYPALKAARFTPVEAMTHL
jgi:ABC-type lipoprotein release transport system permease subunit